MKFDFETKDNDDTNLIPLINIVFLILIFFLIATVIRPFTAKNIKLAATNSEESLHRLTHHLVIDKEGQLTGKGKSLAITDLSNVFQIDESQDHTLNIIADKELPAEKLLQIVEEIQKLKFKKIKLVTEKTS